MKIKKKNLLFLKQQQNVLLIFLNNINGNKIENNKIFYFNILYYVV